VGAARQFTVDRRPALLAGRWRQTKHPIDGPAPGTNDLGEPTRDGTRKIAARERNTPVGI